MGIRFRASVHGIPRFAPSPYDKQQENVAVVVLGSLKKGCHENTLVRRGVPQSLTQSL